MATFRARYGGLQEVIATLAPQVDALLIYANGPRDDFPNLAAWSNVQVTFAAEAAGDLSANGKIYPLDHLEQAYVFTVDDDIIYPPDYVDQLAGLLDALNRRCCVAVHASILAASATWYYERPHYFGGDEPLCHHQLAALAGSGTVAFHQSTLPLRFRDMPREVMVDLVLSLAAHRAGLPIIVPARPAGWLRFRSERGLLHSHRSRLTHHTACARRADWSFAPRAARLRAAFRRTFGRFSSVDARCLGFEPELVHALTTDEPPTVWAQSARVYERRRRFARLVLRA